MLHFFSLGSGSCGNCYYISDGEIAILIDAGVGIRRFKRNMRDYGIKVSNIKAILITHDHADHIKAVGHISNEINVPVYTTETIHNSIKNNFNAIRKINNEHIRHIEELSPFNIGSFKITAYKIPHDSTENVAYKIEHEGKTFSIMTDVGAPTENVNNIITQSNYLVIEANYDDVMLRNGKYPQHLKERITCGTGHMSNKQTADTLAQNFHEGLSHIWLCHLSEENNHPELARKTIEFHLRGYGLIEGTDYNLTVLKRKIPTGPFEL
jgi:phosphoribosyl 1,2-cyclic phosphodiesterase